MSDFTAAFFSVHLNDLYDEIKSQELGVTVGDDLICMLMYADDVCFIAETEQDLQAMLNTLDSWCTKWKLQVNAKKTQVVHFRYGPSVNRTTFQFTCGVDCIKVVDKYRYLGLIFLEFLNFELMVKSVAQAAHRALGLLIAKDKVQGGMPFSCFSKLFDQLVQPIIDYGAGIWGHKSFSSISRVQYRAARYYLGLGPKTPLPVLYGDTGWKQPDHRMWLCTIRQWRRLANMDDTRLNKKVFIWGQSKRNYLRNIKAFMSQHNMDNLLALDTNCMPREAADLLNDVLTSYYEDQWRIKINQIEGVHGTGQNKLRTYRQFKQQPCCEPYVKTIMSRKCRSAMAKIRSGTAPIRLETGRYERPVLPPQDRICRLCDVQECESEEHFLIRCSQYDDIRNEWFHAANNIDNTFFQKCDTEKLIFVICQPNLVNISAKAICDMLNRRSYLLY